MTSGALVRQLVWGFITNDSRSTWLHLLNFLGNSELRARDVTIRKFHMPVCPFPPNMSHETLPKAFSHDAATSLPWYRTIAAMDVFIMGHAQVVAHLMGHGGCYTNRVPEVVL